MLPENCPVCGEPKSRTPGPFDKHPDHTRYSCGSTTMSLAEGFHLRKGEPRDEALWKKHLNDSGRRLADPML